jgi:thioredoxin reductase
VTGLVIESAIDGARQELAVDGVFEYVGVNPQNVLMYDVLERDDKGYLITDEGGASSMRGVFVAGDITTTPLKQVITAAGSGAAAGFSALQYVDMLSS